MGDSVVRVPAYPVFGLALSGGGVRGAAHIGILKAFLEEGILPRSVAGASAGGIVAGLFASGMQIDEMEETVRYLARRGCHYLDPDYLGLLGFIPQILSRSPVGLKGLLKGNRLMKLLCQLSEGQRLEQVGKRLLIPAVDLRSGRTICYTNMPDPKPVSGVRWEREGELGRIMMASASVPAVFCPRHLGDYCLVDGGVTYNLPADLLVAAGEPFVVSVELGGQYEMPDRDTVLETITHSFTIMRDSLEECSSRKELILLRPDLPKDAGLLSFEAMPECMEAGYRYGRQMAPKVKAVLKNTKRS